MTSANGLAKLAAAVKTARDAKGLSQQQVADTAGVKRGVLAHLEQGRGNPSHDYIRRICSALGIDSAQWVGTAVQPPLWTPEQAPSKAARAPKRPNRRPGSNSARVLTIDNFGPIRHVEVKFADITVLVGPQATGKSLVLQWLKLAVDRERILGTLGQHGYDVEGKAALLTGWFFGAGYQHSPGTNTRVTFADKPVDVRALAKSRRRNEPHHALVVPAHRALVMGTGFPLVFRSFDDDTPFVVRDFSERLRILLSQRIEHDVFPAKKRFREEIRERLDAALFHGGKVVVESKGLGGRELRLVHSDISLSLMEWTTGQREALPLLAGLYDALPPGLPNKGKKKPIEWVIVEEPELGLHPNGILAVLFLLLEVVRRGYRLVVSTHSPLILEILWAMQALRDDPKRVGKLLRMFGAKETAFTKDLAALVLGKSQNITYLDFDGDRVVSTDITSLDPAATDEANSGWGGLLGHSTQIANIVAEGR